ncbi:MAG TPA: hypothetical protein VIK86_01255 [Candidatus Paceibacterota bacterium]
MKKIIILILFCIIILNCNAQNRFTQLFNEADSAFNELQRIKTFNDIFNYIEISDDKNKIEITEQQLLLFYFTAYLNGSINAIEKKECDLEQLLRDLNKNKNTFKYLKL